MEWSCPRPSLSITGHAPRDLPLRMADILQAFAHYPLPSYCRWSDAVGWATGSQRLKNPVSGIPKGSFSQTMRNPL